MSAAELPGAELPGVVPTLNGRGFMLEALDDFSRDFAESAGRSASEVLDVGCAYGVATLAALEAGGRVCACDMEPRHLELLVARTPPAYRDRLRTRIGILPGVEFPAVSFSHILASRVIHFLDGAEIGIAIRAMADWLEPGGRLYLVVDSPYMPSWDRIVPAYEAAKRAGDPWPAFIPDFRQLLPAGRNMDSAPAFLNPLDPDLLSRECRRAGLEVERASFFGMHRLGASSNGREHAACVALKPG